MQAKRVINSNCLDVSLPPFYNKAWKTCIVFISFVCYQLLSRDEQWTFNAFRLLLTGQRMFATLLAALTFELWCLKLTLMFEVSGVWKPASFVRRRSRPITLVSMYEDELMWNHVEWGGIYRCSLTALVLFAWSKWARRCLMVTGPVWYESVFWSWPLCGGNGWAILSVSVQVTSISFSEHYTPLHRSWIYKYSLTDSLCMGTFEYLYDSSWNRWITPTWIC